MKRITTLKMTMISAVLLTPLSFAIIAGEQTLSLEKTVKSEQKTKVKSAALKGTEVVNIGGDGKWPDDTQQLRTQSLCFLSLCFKG